MADPVTLAEAKAHLRVTLPNEDGVIQSALDAAIQHVESITGITLEASQVVETLDYGSDRLRAWPVQSITAVSYIDELGAEQVIDASNFTVASYRRPARFRLVGMQWPVARPVQVTIETGYATPDAPPAALRQAILIATGYFYRNREGTEAMPDAVDRLCRPHRLMTV